MSDKCKLCTQRVKESAAQSLNGERSELLQCLFQKFEIKYDPKSKLCTSCMKNLKAMNFVLNRWHQAQIGRTDETKVNTKEAEEDSGASTEEERPLTRTLLKKRAVTIANELDKKPSRASTKSTLNDATKLRSATTEKPPSPLKCLKTEIKKSLELLSDGTNDVKYEVVELDSDEEANKTKSKKNDTLAKPKVNSNIEEKPKRSETKKTQTNAYTDNDGEADHNKEQNETTTGSGTKRLKLKVSPNRKRIKRTEASKIQSIAYMNEDGDVEYSEENKNGQNKEDMKRKRSKIDTDYEPEAIENIPTDNEEKTVSKSTKKANQGNPSKVFDVNDMTLIAVTRGAQGGKLAQLFEDNTVEREEETTQWCALCANCREVFGCMRDLTKHLKTHQKPYYECEECLESYETLNELQQHQQSANHVGVCTADDEDKKMMFFECAHCEKIFLEHYNMVRHYREVHVASSDRYKCSQCGSCFKYKISLQEHLAKHLNLNLNTITCTQCDKTFKNNYQLNRHMLIHTGEQPHQCEQCQKRFRHRANLIVHLRTHTGELPFTCVNCNKGFSTSTHMRRHYESCVKRWLKKENKNSRTMVTLKEEELQFNPQKSTNSEVVFTLNTQKIINDNQDDSLLKRSFVQRQKPEKEKRPTSPIKREVIEPKPKITKYFSQEKRQLTDQNEKDKNTKSLMKLSSQQTEAQPHVYKCKYCNKGYTQRSGLERHIRTHTGEKPYRCTQCKLTFADPSNFKRHRLSHNPTNENIDIEIATLASDSPTGSDDEGAATDPDPDANEQRSHGNFRIVSLNEM